MSTGDRSWESEFAAAAGSLRAREAAALLERIPPGYREATSPAEAAADLEIVASLPPVGSGGTGGPDAAPGPALGGGDRLVVRPSSDPSCSFRLRRFGRESMVLTSVLPVLESFGLVVVEALPFRVPTGDDGPVLHIDDIGLRADAPYGPEESRFVPEIHGGRLVEAIEAAAGHRTDVDGLNRLVTVAGLDWRQVMVLRAYLRYWRQTGVSLSEAEMTGPLVEYPDVVRALVGYFLARFDPDGPGGPGREADGERARCLAELEMVGRLDQDRVLRGLLGLVDATLRTNYWAGAGSDDTPLVLKLSAPAVPEMRPPIPLYETFVHGPALEGLHLRAGPIARGGIRWSERPDDFRTEVLDLAFAQVKKNAIIVPTGAKGGFVCRPAAAAPGVAARGGVDPMTVRRAYETFVSALLDVTDDLRDGRVVTPPRVAAADGPDPYLVVAADKGTATFSDLANSISEGRGFWLGDAFASGGSRGYDHKAMGITARGAWVAVRRHFRELGLDVASDAIKVVGVGDMSGDVFGNGMLRSRAIRLVAAFDHRHIFLDPSPDADTSFDERARLASLGRSSWADYDHRLISPGGGVWPRDAKSVPISPEMASVLGVSETGMSPPQLISAILGAPVDLLFFGGIGTYVRAPDESDAAVGDHANDGVRVTSDQVRARVVAEGANLGVTQQARIRYSRRGGRINADFIDNAAGVATSDREVNIKILLGLAIERGRLEAAERDRYLREAESEVASEVLRQVDHSVVALNRAATASERDLDAYEALVDALEATGALDREVEVLPGRDEFARRRAGGAGLIRPELATVLAYAKTEIVAALTDSPELTDEVFLDSVLPYFPEGMRRDFADLVPHHRLYRQLAATDIAGELVDRMGIVWAHDLAAELGRPLAEVAQAFWVARRVSSSADCWDRLEAMADDPAAAVSPATEATLHSSTAAAVNELVRTWLGRPARFDPAGTASRCESLLAGLPEGMGLSGALLPGDVGLAASDLALFGEPGRRVRVLEAVEATVETGRSAAEGLEVLQLIDRLAGAGELAGAVLAASEASPPPGRIRLWQARAVADDLAAWRRRVARSVLLADPWPGAEAAAAAWAESNRPALARAAALSAAGGSSDPVALAALALRRLAQA